MPSLWHVVVIDAVQGAVVHMRRGEDGRVRTRIPDEGEVRLDPLDLALRVEDLLPPSDGVAPGFERA
jgi:hypothetical protein